MAKREFETQDEKVAYDNGFLDAKALASRALTAVHFALEGHHTIDGGEVIRMMRAKIDAMKPTDGRA